MQKLRFKCKKFKNNWKCLKNIANLRCGEKTYKSNEVVVYNKCFGIKNKSKIIYYHENCENKYRIKITKICKNGEKRYKINILVYCKLTRKKYKIKFKI